MKKNILLIGDYIVDEFLEDLCELNCEYKVSHIYVLNVSPQQEKIINNNNIEVIKGWLDYTEIKHDVFDDKILDSESLNSQKFNQIKAFYRFFETHDFFFNEAEYYERCNFWMKFFSQKKIDLIISPRPSSFDAIPIYIAEKFFNIKILTRMVVMRNNTDGTFRNCILDESNRSFLNFKYDKDFCVEKNLFPKNSLIRKIILPKIYKLMIFNLWRFKLSSFFQNISSIFYFFEFKKFLNQKSETPDLNKNYVFYSMHLDPEATTTPYENILANQLINIRKLSNAIPDDWLVYVKFHPAQINYSFCFRPYECYGNVMRYYKSPESIRYLLNLKNVRIVKTNFSQSELIKNSFFTSAICGSVFLEASYFRTPTVVFGNKTIYNSFLNSYNVNTIAQIKLAIIEIERKINKTINSNHDEVLRNYTYNSDIESVKVVKSILSYLGSKNI